MGKSFFKFKVGWGKKGPYSSMNVGGIKKRSHAFKKGKNVKRSEDDVLYTAIALIIVILIVVGILYFLWNFIYG